LIKTRNFCKKLRKAGVTFGVETLLIIGKCLVECLWAKARFERLFGLKKGRKEVQKSYCMSNLTNTVHQNAFFANI
jgi:hypothetical protein